MARPAPTDPGKARESILSAWETNNRVTIFLVDQLPREVWEAAVPEVPRRTVRGIAAHLHNSRRAWIRKLRGESGVPLPEPVDKRRASRRELVAALRRSGEAMRRLLEFGFECGGEIPAPPIYVWRNLPLDVGHVLSYFVAHEGHHRGQLVLISRQLGYPIPQSTVAGLWGWTRWAREARASKKQS